MRKPGSAPRVLRCWWLAIALLMAWPAHAAAVSGAGEKQVLVLYVTRRDAQIAILGDRQLPAILERGLGRRVDFYSEYLDLARFPDKGYQEAVRDFLRAKYLQQTFDLVIAMHQTTLAFAAENRQQLFPDVPIVFYSESSDTRRAPNSTGVMSPRDFASSVAFALKLQPALRNVFLIVGSEGRDAEFERTARAQLAFYDSRLTFTFLSGLPTDRLKSRLANLPPNSMAYYLVVNRDGAGALKHPLEYIEDLSPSVNAPLYGWVDSMMGRGIVGGALKSQEKQLQAVGELAVRVLRGERADDIRVATPDLIVNQVDAREMQRWGLSTANLPAGTLVRFREPTLWNRYKWYIVGAVVIVFAQTTLIAGLLLEGRRRREAEAHLRGSQAALHGSYERIRKLGSRLLTAQDSERAKIARELHDDVGQQVALLSVDLELLRRGAETDPSSVDQALDRTHAISRSLHDLAHSLYPAKLRLIGLVPALQGLQREISRSGMIVSFAHWNVPPALPPDLTLCLFRVTQEALQNALKYSRAHSVTVRLEAGLEGLALTIADDGAGFDIEKVLGSGLGLLSMRERIEAIGGTFEIRSRPGDGTSLQVVVPLPVEGRAAAAV